jgi:hypothetical protein
VSAPFVVKVEPYGQGQRVHEKVAGALVSRGPLRGQLGGADHRLLSFELLEPERKTAAPRERDRFRATYYDYSNNRTLHVEGRLGEPEGAAVSVSARQPRPTGAEFEAAVAILRRSAELGPALRSGALRPYRPMPPLVSHVRPDGSVERTLAVGLLPAGRGKPGHEIVGVNMIRRRVERYDDGAPPTALAGPGLCGVAVDAGQPTTDQGVAGQALVSVFSGRTLLWRFVAVRPSASAGTNGSGVELRYVDYRGKRVLFQAHVPILNVRYDQDRCGPYRDWQYEEGMLVAKGKDVAPGFRLCSSPAQTILDTGSDTGDYLGTAIYVDGEEVVLVSELQAGWYRYVSEWRLHADGTIRPRFAFDAVSSACVCNRHHHHAYWRLDFDIRTPGDNVVKEFNDPPVFGRSKWHTTAYEVMRFRDAAHKRRWRVEHAPSGAGYEIVPGANDHSAVGDPYAVGDVWLLRWHGSEIDDDPAPDTSIHIGKFNDHEPIANEDVVVWYGAHFTHDVQGPEVSHVVGPDLVPYGW